MAYKKTLQDKRVLITCGPTWIPIDDTRIIGNISTGRLGEIIAKDFAHAGARVTLLEGPVLKGAQLHNVKIKKFHYYEEYLTLIKKELKKKYDCVLHAAAISDYKLKNPYRTKIRSGIRKFQLELIPTKKIINLIKTFNPNVLLVGFKLRPKITKATAIEKSKVLFDKAKCDFVVANSAYDSKYEGYILDKHNKFLAHKRTRQGISKALVDIVRNQL